MRRFVLPLSLIFACHLPLAADEPPRSRDPRIKIELFAEHPQIVTPTGIDVDHAGRVWVIESNTHFRPQDYKGHLSDRLLVMSDANGDGRADKIATFADGFKYAMSVVVRPLWFPEVAPQAKSSPNALSAYVATRREVSLLHDDDGDLKADRRTVIARLDSKGDYPHNAINGFALHPLGWLYFGMGENLGADYKLIGSDGTTLSGGGEGGNMFRCRPDGSKLERVATGFWNPHASCFDAFGRLFTVDNDPDSRPPCRLLHVIPGGDYGFRFRNGRKGLHPFTSWNGEIAGTLPMVAGTGEAPGGIVAYESDGLPEEYIGNLLVTSWGDHRIDRFRLKPKGTSFTSLAEPLIVGGENFRPVGLACAPDGSLYCSDWMLRDYNLHGHGRLWRISPTTVRQAQVLDVSQLAAQPIGQIGSLLNSRRLDVRRTLLDALAGIPEMQPLLRELSDDSGSSSRLRVESFWASLRRPAKIKDREFGIWILRIDVSPVVTARAWAVDEPQLPQSAMSDYRFMESWLRPRTIDRHPLRTQLGLDHDFDNTLPLAAIWVAQHQMQTLNANDLENLLLFDKDDPFTFLMAVNLVEKLWGRTGTPQFFDIEQWKDPRSRLGLLLAFRRGQPQNIERLKWFLRDRDPHVRRAVMQWIAEERITKFRPLVLRTLNETNFSADLFLATLAALEMLDGVPPAEFDKTPPGKYVLPLVKDDNRPPAVRALALRLVNPADVALTVPLLESLLAANDPALKLETVRTLKFSPLAEAGKLLRSVADDASQDSQLRLEAIAGLGRDAHSAPADQQTLEFLLKLALEKKSDLPLRVEALRGLRGHPFDARQQVRIKKQLADELTAPEASPVKSAKLPEETQLFDQFVLTFQGVPRARELLQPFRKPRPQDRAGWLQAIGRDALPNPERKQVQPEISADAPSGSRLFFHPNSAGCYKCHTVNGRGGKIGPDLSTIGRSHSREKLLDSILEPSREIAPQFISWSIETRQGQVFTGMIVHENEGRTVLGDNTGKLTELKTIDVVERVPQKTSVMPDKLIDRLTVQEVRDLLAFLESLR